MYIVTSFKILNNFILGTLLNTIKQNFDRKMDSISKLCVFN